MAADYAVMTDQKVEAYRVLSVEAKDGICRLILDNFVDVPGSEPALLWEQDGQTWLHWRGADIRINGLNMSSPDFSTFTRINVDLTFTLE